MVIRRFEPDHGGIAATVHAADQATVVPVTEAILDDSQRYVPVLTGALRASGETSYADDFSTGYVSYGDEEVDYAAYQEFGTTYMSAQPYLRPAAYQRRSL